MEEWKSIDGFPDYQVSNLGRVKSLERTILSGCRWGSDTSRTYPERILKPTDNGTGYLTISMADETNTFRRRLVHRLVGLAFISNPDNKPEIDHINRNKSDNSVSNLRWATRSENIINRPSRTNEPYIRQVIYVEVPGHKRKHFMNLEDAIEYRNKLIIHQEKS